MVVANIGYSKSCVRFKNMYVADLQSNGDILCARTVVKVTNAFLLFQ